MIIFAHILWCVSAYILMGVGVGTLFVVTCHPVRTSNVMMVVLFWPAFVSLIIGVMSVCLLVALFDRNPYRRN